MTSFSFASRITLEYVQSTFKGTDPLGFTFTEVRSNSLCGTLKVDDRHLRPGGILNGGISLLLIETMGSASACCGIDFEKENALGLQVSANHLGIALRGDQLRIVSKPIHIGRSTHIWEVNIENQDQKPVSTGRITLMITPQSEQL